MSGDGRDEARFISVERVTVGTFLVKVEAQCPSQQTVLIILTDCQNLQWGKPVDFKG